MVVPGVREVRCNGRSPGRLFNVERESFSAVESRIVQKCFAEGSLQGWG